MRKICARYRAFWASAVLIGLMLAAGTAAGAPAGYSMQISFTNFAGRGTLTNFPALVKFTTNNTDNYTGFIDTTDGWDLRFWTNSAMAGDELYYEIESFDTNTNSYVWVQIPELTNNLSIWATWGDSVNANQETYTTNGYVWSEGFAGVWHLSDATAQDSTAYGNHGTSSGNTDTNGIVDGAQNFIDSGDVITVGDISASAYHISFWANLQTTIVSEGTKQVPIILGNNPSQDLIGCGSISGYATGESLMIADNNADGSYGRTYITNTLAAGWRFMAFTWNGSSYQIYLDGDTKTTIAGSQGDTPLQPVANLVFGTATFDGILDEICISSIARSSNWIWACYMNQGENHSNFVEYGSVVDPPPGPPTVSTDTGATAQSLGAILNGRIAYDGQTTLDDVRIYFGLTDGGTNAPLTWDTNFVFNAGSLSSGSTFSTNVTDLVYGVVYTYRVFASNANGVAWSDAATFTTLPPPVDVTIQESGYGGKLRYNHGTSLYYYYQGLANVKVGSSGTDHVYHENMILMFELPERPGAGFQSENTSLSVTLSANDGGSGHYADLWAVGYVPAEAIGAVGSSLNGGATDVDDFWLDNADSETKSGWNLNSANTTKIWDNLANNGTAINTPLIAPVSAESALTAFVNSLFTSHGASAGDYLALRINVDKNVDYRDWDFYSGVAANYQPELSLSSPVVWIGNTTATNETATTADLLGTLDAPQSVFTVSVYWSTSNNLTQAQWESDGTASNAVLGTYTNVVGLSLSNNVSLLDSATTYYYAYVATNAATNLWALPRGTFETPAADGEVAIANRAADNIANTTARLNARLQTPGTNATVITYWWVTGGATTNAYTNSVPYNDVADTNVSYTATGLTPNADYSFTWRATNATQNKLAEPALTFRTHGQPSVELVNGMTVVSGAIKLDGRVVEDGEETPVVRIYLTADTDPGATTSGWDTNFTITGWTEGDTFSNTVSDLLFGIEYFYRVYASNSYGEAWSAVSTFKPAIGIDIGDGNWDDPGEDNANGLQIEAALFGKIGTGGGEKIVTVSGVTFTLNPGGAETVGAWADYSNIKDEETRYSAAVPWTIEGLTPGGGYNLVFLSAFNSQPGKFTIDGVGTATPDADGDGNFEDVRADELGVVSGTWDILDSVNYSTFTALLIEYSSAPLSSGSVFLFR